MRTPLLLLLPFLLALLASSSPLGLSRIRAMNVRPERGRMGKLQNWISRLFTWPNSFYDKPHYRYPYYDRKGRGLLLYGYGGRDLYRYSQFTPLEGYFRR
jgi:hypothetical protein